MRDSTFDVMKGIGIIAMIIAHCLVPRMVGNFIFAWHMPLFFIVSGYFYKSYPIKEYTKRNFRTLVVPYLITATLMFLLCVLEFYIDEETDIIHPFIGIFVASGSKGLPMFGDYFVGAIWFLLAMFWCRVIFNIVTNKSLETRAGIIIIILSILSTYIGTKIFIPTDLLQGLSAMVFFYIGNLFRKRNIFEMRPNWLITILGVLTIIASLLTCNNDYPLSMVRCYYGYYPINVVAACFCTYLLYQIASYVKNNAINVFFAYLGKISMLILCVHIIDLNHDVIKILNNTCIQLEGKAYHITSLIWHLTFAILFSILLSKNKKICNLFQIHYE